MLQCIGCMELCHSVRVDYDYITLREHHRQSAKKLSRDLLISEDVALRIFWCLLSNEEIIIQALKRGEQSDRRVAACVKLQSSTLTSQLLIALEKTPHCVEVVTAYPHPRCVVHFLIPVETVSDRCKDLQSVNGKRHDK